MPMSQRQQGLILNAIYNATSYSSPATIYFGLSTQAVSGATDALILSGEPSSTGSYARVAKTANTTNFPTATGSNPTLLANGTAVSFPTSTSSGYSSGNSTLGTLFAADAVTLGGGNVIWYGQITSSGTLVVNASGITISFAIGAIQFTLF
jgi:hypothetical protein